MKNVNIIGVPEHFNFPWQLAIEEGAFEARGINIKWKDIPEGTGKMVQLLKDNKTDLAIILTEGIIKSITEGNPSKIVQEYIATPLLWGIHVAAKSNYRTLGDLKNKTAAISRYGSGSHLMAYVNAQGQSWDTKELKFEVVDNLDGAVASLTEGRADYFMWERFTTKPLVDQGVFRRIADCPTPWPCFVIAATDKFITENPGTLAHILETINIYTSDFKQIPSIDRTLANRYKQQLEDIKHWLSLTQWGHRNISKQNLELAQNTLKDLRLIEKVVSNTEIVYMAT
ncbi:MULTISPECIES: substrate-binding domain-containing protein [unclassified Arenibacter]|jgi:ABC-type nitrate/sulfonate/bicarbonate transport system substrate-binding protein|uniref:substrate-binding domain-containing protein n=1 Tax=unclassified Arenibacter TaxID=2615047 RepID=UPI000E349BF4|nr:MULTISPECIES: substrate-binding domain-containing protein [unclassified Arenibacter]MCM4163249.1 ABC transporter substrate-binding protein [Arenibacter sp. A80]RFT57266.1 ABC transporter substrate-binding protein [Arenibacter sp. P308M17]